MGTVTSQTHDRVTTPAWMLWAGRVVSVLPVLIVLMSARWKLTSEPFYVQEWGRLGWQASALPLIASLQLVAITLYVIPPTAVLGAVLLTGYMGGAIASYVRIAEFYPPMLPLSTAVLAWLGLFLRDARVRRLLPIRWPITRV
jgi:hypothetical protein